MTVQDQPEDEDVRNDISGTPFSESARNAVAAEVIAGSVVQARTIGGIQLPPPASLPRPQQLQAAPPGFVGRAAELARLTAALDRTADAGERC